LLIGANAILNRIEHNRLVGQTADPSSAGTRILVDSTNPILQQNLFVSNTFVDNANHVIDPSGPIQGQPLGTTVSAATSTRASSRGRRESR